MKFNNKEPHKTINPKRIYEVKQVDFCNVGISDYPSQSPKKESQKTHKSDSPNESTKNYYPIEITQYDIELANETCEVFLDVIKSAVKIDDFEGYIIRRNL